ncbi:MAG: hypothetical protein PVG32_19895 [Anaerolineales bacterium]
MGADEAASRSFATRELGYFTRKFQQASVRHLTLLDTGLRAVERCAPQVEAGVWRLAVALRLTDRETVTGGAIPKRHVYVVIFGPRVHP